MLPIRDRVDLAINVYSTLPNGALPSDCLVLYTGVGGYLLLYRDTLCFLQTQSTGQAIFEDVFV